MQTAVSASLCVGGQGTNTLRAPLPRAAALSWCHGTIGVAGVFGGCKKNSQPRATVVQAASAATGADKAYSRSSWRTAIVEETGQQDSGDTSTAVNPARQAGGPSAADSSEGIDYGTLSAAELRVKLALAAGSGRLDLTECRLQGLPPGVLDLAELEELQLSGNCLTHLPDDISRLTGLRRLGLAGNLLTHLPAGIGALTGLEGLWLHGNLLESLPPQLGRLGALRALSLAGNCLESVPAGALSGLTSLTDLTLAGNRLSALPPHELAPLSRLRKLALNGNRLTACSPGELGLGAHMTALTELMLQGNCLEEVDPHVFECPALQELSLADNQLSTLPPRLAGASSLSRLHLFGNRLTTVPARQLASLPALSSCWLEGNSLNGETVAELVAAAASGGMPRLKAIGLDQSQIATATAVGGPTAQPHPSSGSSGLPANVRVGCVLGSGPGYFKLQYGPQHHVSSGAADGDRADSGGRIGVGSSSTGVCSSNKLLVVAFGSAPGTPNWAGLLTKVYRAAASEAESYFDVLYVADPARDWYGGGDESSYDYYHSRLLSYTSQYDRVLLLGDSMGATAALLFADLATGALAFCPQVDLTAASIRPGRPTNWLDHLQNRLMASVRASSGELLVLVGTWQHDLAQANMLPQGPSKGQGQAGGSWHARDGMAGSRKSRDAERELALRSWRQVETAALKQTAATSASTRLVVGQQREGSAGESDEVDASKAGSSSPQAAELSRQTGADTGYCGGGVSVRVFSVDSHRLAAALDSRMELVPLVRDAVLHQLGLRSGNVRVANLL